MTDPHKSDDFPAGALDALAAELFAALDVEEARQTVPHAVDPELHLMWAVQALAQPAAAQAALFPPFVVVADELALDFDDHRRTAEAHIGDSWSPDQRAAIATLNRELTEMSGPGKPELWLDRGCLGHPRWAVVRQLARAALAAFNWSDEPPPSGRAVYVPG